MPGLLTHSPAKIVQQLLINNGLGTAPVAGDAWPVYVSSEPDLPDQVITVSNGVDQIVGFSQPDRQCEEFHGIQIRVRGLNNSDTHTKIHEIAIALDQDIYRQEVVIDSSTYCVHSINRTSGPFDLGKNVPNSRRSLFTVNGLSYLLQLS